MQGLHINTVAALFPPPKFLSMPAAGIDISETSIKYLDAQYSSKGLIPDVFDSVRLPKGVIVEGVVEDIPGLTTALKELKSRNKRKFANVSLPEELVYLYTLEVPTAHSKKEVMQVIEFSLSDHAPIPVDNAVFNYGVIRERGDITEVSVTVFPKNVVEGYKQAFENSGFEVVGFELEASSIARALIPHKTKQVSMIIDFGRARTGITIVSGRTPIFSTTVKIGGNAFTESVTKHMGVSEEEASIIKREHGITNCENQEMCKEFIDTATVLIKEIQRHYRYWDTRRDDEGNRIAGIEKILLCGGGVGLLGLPEHIASVLKVPVRVGNVWENMFSLDEHIPKVERVVSWGYATAVGLLLRDQN
ncbi:hypothetical protein COB52_00785 [Candidatus Kaiserbacteria bacterium]|nr:MAG: hypothetical protein COB52_00785 [Candidatus Kaiserbacteria bacterium]